MSDFLKNDYPRPQMIRGDSSWQNLNENGILNLILV